MNKFKCIKSSPQGLIEGEEYTYEIYKVVSYNAHVSRAFVVTIGGDIVYFYEEGGVNCVYDHFNLRQIERSKKIDGIFLD